MLLENLLSELSKLNNHLDRIASQPSSFPLSSPDVNTAQDEQETAVDPIKRAGKRTYLQHDDGGFLTVEKGEEMPGEGYNRITKAEYAALASSASSASKDEPEDTEKSDEPEQTNLDLGVVTEDMCRNSLRELRAQLIESKESDRDANLLVHNVLKLFSEKGSLPDVLPEHYPALYAETLKRLGSTQAMLSDAT